MMRLPKIFQRAAAGACLLACAGCTPPREAPDRLVVWHQKTGAERAFFEEAVASYNRQHPGEQVVALYREGEELRNSFIIAAVAGQGPDLVFGPSDNVAVFAGTRVIRPWDAVVGPEFFERFTADGIVRWEGQPWMVADQIGNQSAALVAGMDDLGRHATGEAVILAAAIARKLAAAFVEREPTGELSALIADCMSSLNGVPHLVIRCAPELADAVRDIATARMQTSGFSGRLVVLGDPDIPLGDARLEWADGGVVRSSAEINAEIDRRIADYFAAHGIVANPDEEISQ